MATMHTVRWLLLVRWSLVSSGALPVRTVACLTSPAIACRRPRFHVPLRMQEQAAPPPAAEPQPPAPPPSFAELLKFTLFAAPIYVSPTLLSLIDTAVVGQVSSVQVPRVVGRLNPQLDTALLTTLSCPASARSIGTGVRHLRRDHWHDGVH
jgi:hypothetical protein